jgi:hypothetical protein
MSVSGTTTTLTITTGECRDSTNAITMASAITSKVLGTGTFAAGNAGNGKFSGATAVSAGVWYHVFVIRKDSDGSIDVGFDSSVSAANKPAGYAYVRRVGSIQCADSSGNIAPFKQFGDEFIWATTWSSADFSQAMTLAGGAVLCTLNVPPGVQVWADFVIDGSTGPVSAYVSSPDAADQAVAPANGIGGFYCAAAGATLRLSRIRTNTSSQVRVRINTTATMSGTALGWTDNRGKD